MNFETISKAPTRVDLAGGTLDIWPIHHVIPKCKTINIAIDTFNEIKINANTDQFVIESKDLNAKTSFADYEEIHTDGELNLLWRVVKHYWNKDLPKLHIESYALSPAGAGLGGSSSLALNLGYHLCKLKNKFQNISKEPDMYSLVKTIKDIEVTQIHTPTGEQDYWAPVYGGLNVISYPPGKTKVESVSEDFAKQLESMMLTVYSGQSRASAMNNWILYKCVFEKNMEVVNMFKQIAETTTLAADSIENNDLDEFIQHTKKEWQHRCQLFPGIQTPVTKKLTNDAKEIGAIYSRVCGAGGGGVMALFFPPAKKEKALQRLTAKGYKAVSYTHLTLPTKRIV